TLGLRLCERFQWGDGRALHDKDQRADRDRGHACDEPAGTHTPATASGRCGDQPVGDRVIAAAVMQVAQHLVHETHASNSVIAAAAKYAPAATNTNDAANIAVRSQPPAVVPSTDSVSSIAARACSRATWFAPGPNAASNAL